MTACDTVLLVEDNGVLREGLAHVLRQAGYAVASAGDASEALAYLRSHPPPAVILLDLVLPVLDGWHLLGQLKQLPASASVPIAVVTATALTREWAQAQGCAGVVWKPFDTGALLAELRRCRG
jgi:CheY-like chemotaxis protein